MAMFVRFEYENGVSEAEEEVKSKEALSDKIELEKTFKSIPKVVKVHINVVLNGIRTLTHGGGHIDYLLTNIYLKCE